MNNREPNSIWVEVKEYTLEREHCVMFVLESDNAPTQITVLERLYGIGSRTAISIPAVYGSIAYMRLFTQAVNKAIEIAKELEDDSKPKVPSKFAVGELMTLKESFDLLWRVKKYWFDESCQQYIYKLQPVSRTSELYAVNFKEDAIEAYSRPGE